jgi:hypothetical protein
LATLRNRHVAGVRERRLLTEHGVASPFHEARPHLPDENQRRVLEMLHLQQLPDHHRLQHRTDAAGRHHERVRREHELVQAGEECPMLEGFGDEGVDVLLEGQVHANADGLPGPDCGRAFVRRLHQPRPTASDDVTIHLGQRRGHAFGFVIAESARLHACGSENRDAIAISAGWLQAGQVVDDVPESQDRVHQDLLHALLVAEAYRCRSAVS